MTILAGDLGGTKTVLALYRPEDPIDRPCRSEKFPSGDYEDLESIVERFFGRDRRDAAGGGVRRRRTDRRRQGAHHQPQVGCRSRAPFRFVRHRRPGPAQRPAGDGARHPAPRARGSLHPQPWNSGAGRIDRGYRGGNRARHSVPGSWARRLPGISDGGRTHVVRAARRRRSGAARVPPRTPRPRQLRASLLRHRSSQHLRLPAQLQALPRAGVAAAGTRGHGGPHAGDRRCGDGGAGGHLRGDARHLRARAGRRSRQHVAGAVADAWGVPRRRHPTSHSEAAAAAGLP